MKLKTGADLAAFLEGVRSCSQNVFFDTAEGDHLNLRSTLARFVFTAAAEKLGQLDYRITAAAEDLALLAPWLEEAD